MGEGMKITIRELFALEESLRELLDLRLRARVAFKAAQAARAIRTEQKTAAELRNNLVKQYGKKEKGKGWNVPRDSENWDKYEEEVKELLDTEVCVNCDQVVLPDDLDLKPRILADLAGFVEIGPGPEAPRKE